MPYMEIRVGITLMEEKVTISSTAVRAGIMAKISVGIIL